MSKDMRTCAKEAVSMVIPLALTLVKDHQKKGLYIVVGDPSARAATMNAERWKHDCVLHQQGIGERSGWHKDYAAIALSKAYLSAREGMSTREIQLMRPYILRSGETTYFGSVYRHGVSVGVSGHDALYDEMLAGHIADAFRAIYLASNTDRETDGNGFLLP